MHYRELGQGLTVSGIGLGCMPMTGMADRAATYGTIDVAEAIATLDEAVALGVTFFDTAELYGFHANEAFLGDHLSRHAKKLTIATKFGFSMDDRGNITGVDCSPERARAACEASLRRLKVETIDLYYQHRVDPALPIEETIGGMVRLIEEGKIRHIGLCEVTPETLRRAHAVHPITAVQSEYSLWERGVEREMLPLLDELGIGFVPYSPLGRGFLAGSVTSPSDLAADDHRRNDPRFDEESFAKNMGIVEGVRDVAREAGCSPAQVALAWLLAQGEHVAPIPGAKRLVTMRDSVKAAEVVLTSAMLDRLDALVPSGAGVGARVRESQQQILASR